jgi:hypothetical protein
VIDTLKLEVAVRSPGSLTVKPIVYTPSYAIEVGVALMLNASG